MKKSTSYIAGIVSGILIMALPALADSVTKTLEALVNFTTVKINGVKVESDNFVVDGKTYVWIRDVAEMFGKEIEWDEETNTANIVDELTKVIATVDGTEITNSEVKVSSMLNPVGSSKQAAIQNALDYVIENTVVLNEAVKQGINYSPDTKKAAEESFFQFMQNYGENANSILSSYNLTEEKYLKLIEKHVVLQNFVDYLKKSKVFPDDELKAKYDELFDNFTTVTAKHILIKTDNRTDEQAKAEADKILKELKKPEMFDDLMAKYSEDTGTKDDTKGMVFGKGQMVPEFEDAAFSQEIGKIGKPVKTQYGYHIILVTDRSTKSFEEAKDICNNELFMTWFNEQIEAWKESADIVINNEVLEDLKNN
jgi:parvulin-like peptidyl-prolyl isomerase